MELTLVLAIAILAAGAVLLVIRPLVGGRGGAASRAEADQRLYRAQLDELERDRERGSIRAEEAEAARVEISRRLLNSARQAEAEQGPAPAPPQTSRRLALGAALALPVLAAGAYLYVGNPGEPDQPYAGRDGERALAAGMQRPSQDVAEQIVAGSGGVPLDMQAPTVEEAEYLSLVARLEEALVDRPEDQRGRELLARAYLRLGRNAEAWRVQRELIGLKQGLATADDHAVMVEAMVLAADGYVSPEAEAAIAELLQIDPVHPAGLYYFGMMMAQGGQLAEAVGIWQTLRSQLADGSPQALQIDDVIAAAEAELGAAGAAGSLPGPDDATMGAAADMTPEERQAMIEGMVTGLDERLSADGGSTEEWLRLILSFTQLGRPEDARRAYEAALADHSGDAEALALIRERAASIGIR